MPDNAPRFTGVLVLADGTALWGQGCGATGEALGEVCFNTAMTGYQEILTDPSYAAQIVAFTFPHIGNTGANAADAESLGPVAARGLVLRAPPGPPSNWRSQLPLDAWLKRERVIGLSGIDTRALTRAIRTRGMPNAVIAHAPDGEFDLERLRALAREWGGLEGQDLAKTVSTLQAYSVAEGRFAWPNGPAPIAAPRFEVVLLDYGAKRNIARCLGEIGARVHVMPADSSLEAILARKPHGLVLSNGPGDPAATGRYAAPLIAQLIGQGLPIFGICLGHQMLGLALGARTIKMRQGHHGANHPVKDLASGKVEIVSMNHGFAIDSASLPPEVEETHISLFDGSNCGLRLRGRPVFSVQYHPEASPGPQDSQYLFSQFAAEMTAYKAACA